VASFDVTKKLQIYHTLYRLNLSFAAIVEHCRALQEGGIFSSSSARRYQGFTQELQSQINQELLETMENIENDDWKRHGKVRQTWEKELRGPDDSLIQPKEPIQPKESIQAKEPKREPARGGKRPRR
jgi:hypothetical protein